MSSEKISVILAGYNESENICKAMDTVYSALEDNFDSFELVLVDDASKDDTLTKMKAFAEKHASVRVIPNFVNLNFGTSVLRGLAAAEGDILIYNACDLPLSAEDMIRILKSFTPETDMIVLERTDYKTTRWRGVTSDINKLMLKILYPRLTKGTPVLNFVQAMRRDCMGKIVPLARSPIFVWPEMVFRAKLGGMKVENIPVRCNVENLRKGAFGHPHDIIWGIYDMLRFRIRLWQKKI